MTSEDVTPKPFLRQGFSIAFLKRENCQALQRKCVSFFTSSFRFGKIFIGDMASQATKQSHRIICFTYLTLAEGFLAELLYPLRDF